MPRGNGTGSKGGSVSLLSVTDYLGRPVRCFQPMRIGG
jgi:hypothetical protein